MLILRCNYILSSDLWKKEPLEGEWALQMKAWAAKVAFRSPENDHWLGKQPILWRCIFYIENGDFPPFFRWFSREFCQQIRAFTSPKGVFFHHGHQQRWHWQVGERWHWQVGGGVGNLSLQPQNFAKKFHPQKQVKKTYQPWQKIVFCLEDDVVFFCGYCRFQHLTKKLAAHTGHDTPRIKGHVIYLFTNPSHSPCFVGPGHSLHPLSEDEWTCFNVIKIQSSDTKLRGAI